MMPRLMAGCFSSWQEVRKRMYYATYYTTYYTTYYATYYTN